MSDNVYMNFWIYLAYFLCMILVIIGYVKGYQVWINYGLFFFIVGLLLNISFKLSLLLDIFEDSVVECLMDNDEL